MTLIIIIITAVVSILAFNNRDMFERMKFNAYQVYHSKEYYRFLSYGFIHADWIHLLINMFVLYSFGRIVQTDLAGLFGESRGLFYYFLLYAGALVLSSTPSFGKHKDNIYYNAVGASGAVSAVVFASILLRPDSSIAFIFLPIPIPSPVFGILYLIYSAYMARRGRDNIGHDAHFWGALFGFVFPVILNPELFPRFFELLF